MRSASPFVGEIALGAKAASSAIYLELIARPAPSPLSPAPSARRCAALGLDRSARPRGRFRPDHLVHRSQPPETHRQADLQVVRYRRGQRSGEGATAAEQVTVALSRL